MEKTKIDLKCFYIPFLFRFFLVFKFGSGIRKTFIENIYTMRYYFEEYLYLYKDKNIL